MDKTVNKKRGFFKDGTALTVSRQGLADFAISALGFFMGRVVVFGDVNPLGIAYISSFFLQGSSFYIAAFFTLAGILTKYTFFDSLKYILCIGIMCVLNAFSRVITKKRWINMWQTVGVGILVAASGVTVAFLNGGYLFFILMAVLEGILIFSVSYITKKGMRVIGGKVKRRSLTNEELISLAILAGGLVAGSADIFIGEVSLRYYFSAVIVMVMANKGGLTTGATTGLLLGLLLNVSGYDQAGYIVMLGMAGLIAGGMRELAKQFVSAGFALGCILLAFYVQPDLINTQFLFSILFAGITFILMPDKLMFNISAKINPALDNTESHIDKLKELTVYKLHGFSNAFLRLSKIFSGLSEKRTSLTQKDISNLIDDTAANVCYNCENRAQCWEGNFYNTYQAVFGMLNACEKNGHIELTDIPSDFRDMCKNVIRFSETVNKMFEIYKSNLAWHNRIIESRELVSEQLAGVSKIIDNLSVDLDIEANFKEDLEREILEELNKNKIEVDSVMVLENKLGRYEVNLRHSPCYNKSVCTKEILPFINKILGRKMKNDDNNCFVTKRNGKSTCNLSFIEEQQFRLTGAVARASKDTEKECGDSYSYMELKNGQCILALSDGMGTGKKAREESAAAVELLEEFIETGFDKDTSVKMINSVLLLKSSQESFSTLDICSIDLYTGEAEFMKIGASSTFLARDGNVSVIRSWSLPVGAVNNIDLDISKKQLKDGDIILMVTDGILDVASECDEKEDWVIDALSGVNSFNPQDIADYIIDEAKNKSNGCVNDDMTVVAARFWKKY